MATHGFLRARDAYCVRWRSLKSREEGIKLLYCRISHSQTNVLFASLSIFSHCRIPSLCAGQSSTLRNNIKKWWITLPVWMNSFASLEHCESAAAITRVEILQKVISCALHTMSYFKASCSFKNYGSKI